MERQTRIRKDSDGWAIEAPIKQAENYYHWVAIGWTAGTRRDAERLEQEIVAERGIKHEIITGA
jgi:hypothetical protein